MRHVARLLAAGLDGPRRRNWWPARARQPSAAGCGIRATADTFTARQSLV
jgi:hypothetical protein